MTDVKKTPFENHLLTHNIKNNLSVSVSDFKAASGSQQMTCLTGVVQIEGFSGETFYDDTQVKECYQGQTQCYKQTMGMRVENNWPGTGFGFISDITVISSYCY